MWTTAFDLIKFGTTWSSLLPAALAGEMLRPQSATGSGPGRIGLSWHLNTARGYAGENGVGPGAAVSLVIRPEDHHAYVALTNRQVSIGSLNSRLALRGA